jgi:hypothetical protein
MAVAAVTRHSPSRCLREIGRYAVILRERQHPGLVEEAHGGAPHVRRQVGVPERHLDALVPEQLLDGLERRAAHHEVARERVAEPVRGDALREVHFDGTTSFTIEWLIRFAGLVAEDVRPPEVPMEELSKHGRVGLARRQLRLPASMSAGPSWSRRLDPKYGRRWTRSLHSFACMVLGYRSDRGKCGLSRQEGRAGSFRNRAIRAVSHRGASPDEPAMTRFETSVDGQNRPVMDG